MVTEKTGLELEASVVRKARSSGREFLPFALTSSGPHLFVHSGSMFYRCDGDGLKEVGERYALEDHREAILAAGEDLWACGSAGLLHSSNRGESFAPAPLPISERMVALAVGPDGSLWVGGGYHGGGALLCRGPKSKRFTLVSGPSDMVTCMISTRAGVIVGDRDGALWLGTDGAVKPLAAVSAPLISLLETEAGSLLALTGCLEEWQDLRLLRSTDGGATFEERQLDADLLLATMAQAPGGPIVAGGYGGTIAFSRDDGRSFEALDHDTSAPGQDFLASCTRGGAVLLGGDFNNLVEVRVRGLVEVRTSGASAASPKANATPKKPKPKRQHAKGGRGYVASGRFEKDLEAVVGPLRRRAGKPKRRAPGFDEALERLPAKLASEVDALSRLHAETKLSRLGGLREGGFSSIAAQHGLDEQGVLEAEWFGDPEDAALLAHTVAIYDDQGSPFVIVGEQGVFLLEEDPYAYMRLADSLEDFLRALLVLEAVARARVTVEEAEEALAARLYVDEDERFPPFVERVLS